MKYQPKRVVLWLGLILMLVGILAASVACWGYPEPSMQLIIENQTKQVLTIYYGEVELGDVKPREQVKVENVDGLMGKYLIEAKNIQGEIVFSQTFTWETMQEIERGKVYKAVITPLEE